jgi:hypothetical protein
LATAAVDRAQGQMSAEELIDPCPELGIVAAGLVEQLRPLVGGAIEGSQKDISGVIFAGNHEILAGGLAAISQCDAAW